MMLSDETLAAVDLLQPLLAQFPCGEYGLALGGAHAKGRADAQSDLDLYIFAPAVAPDIERSRLASAFSDEIHGVVSWSTATPFAQAGTDFYLGQLKVECWMRDRAAVERVIDECCAGVIRRDFVTWTTTGYYNHCLLSDLNVMLPVDDRTEMLACWKERIRVYPPPLRAAIIGRHLPAARFWPRNFHYHSAISRCDVIYCTGIVQQVVHNLIQVLFAANEAFFPGDKKLDEALAHLPDLPEQCVERVEALFCLPAPAGALALEGQQRELQRLLEDVERLVERRGLAPK
jgi:hypothetical protein